MKRHAMEERLSPTYEAALRARRPFIFLVGSLGMLIFAVSAQMLPALLASVADAFERDLAQRGLLLGVQYAGFFLSTLLSGHLSDRFGHRTFILIGFALIAAGLGVASAAKSCAAFQAGILMTGLSGGFLESPLSAIVSDAFPDKRAQALNATQMFYNVGAIAGPIAAGFLVGMGFTWRAPFAVFVVLAVAILVFSFACLPRKRRADREREAAEGDEPIPWGFVLALSLALFLYVGGELTTAQWSADYLEQRFAVSAKWSPLALAGFWFGMLWGRGAYIIAIRRTGYVVPMLFSAVLATVAAVCMAYAPSAALAGVFCLLTGFFLAGTWPTILAYAASRVGTRTATVFSVIVATGGLGAMIIPPLAGYIARATGGRHRTILLVGALSILLEGVVLLAVALHRRNATRRNIRSFRIDAADDKR